MLLYRVCFIIGFLRSSADVQIDMLLIQNTYNTMATYLVALSRTTIDPVIKCCGQNTYIFMESHELVLGFSKTLYNELTFHLRLFVFISAYIYNNK